MKMFVIKLMVTSVIIAGFLIAASPNRAQLPMAEGPTKERTQNDSDRDLEERIANMRYLLALAEKRGVPRKKDPKLALEELQEDFTGLQLLNKDLVLTTVKSIELDLKFITRSAGEINRRAARLMSNLALPEPANGGSRTPLPPITDEKQTRAAITSLGSLIYFFTKNPIFKEVKVIEPQSAAKARGDLERIAELSLHLKKSAEQLRKVAK
jgi:hypothetical protein